MDFLHSLPSWPPSMAREDHAPVAGSRCWRRHWFVHCVRVQSTSPLCLCIDILGCCWQIHRLGTHRSWCNRRRHGQPCRSRWLQSRRLCQLRSSRLLCSQGAAKSHCLAWCLHGRVRPRYLRLSCHQQLTTCLTESSQFC